MTKLNKQGKQAAIIAAVLIALAVTCRMLGNNGFYPKTLGLVRSGIYIFLIVAWGVLIDRRIIQTQIRRYMIGISGVMVFWFLLRTWKHHLISAEALPDVTRYIWYAYYIPMLMLPVLALFATVSLGKPEQYRTPLPLRLLWIPTVLLTLTVLTNDLHQTVFSFPAENTPWTDNRYSYGGMYWIVFAWFVINTLLALGMILYKCRIPRSRTFLWLPVIPFALMIVYGLLYITAHSVIAPFAGDMTSVYCVLIVLIFESCIGCGLIQSNSRYAELFKATTLAAQITDKDYAVCLSSDAAQPVSAEVLHEAEVAPVMLDGGTRLSCAPIHSGYIFWREDVSKLLSVLSELSGIQAELEDYHSLLDEENKQKKRRKKFEEQQRLYNAVQEKTAPHLALLSALSRELQAAPSSTDAKRLLGKIAVIGAYLKRRSNLIILADSTGSIPSAELDLCLKETVSNLHMNGITCAVRFDFEDDMSAYAAGVLYDFYEAAVEVAFDTLTGFTAFIRHEAAMFRLSLILQCDTDMARLAAQFSHASVTQEDGVWYCELSIPEGGARL